MKNKRAKLIKVLGVRNIIVLQNRDFFSVHKGQPKKVLTAEMGRWVMAKCWSKGVVWI